MRGNIRINSPLSYNSGKTHEDYYLIKYEFLQHIFEWVDIHKIACIFCKKRMDDETKDKQEMMKFILEHINHIIINDLQKLVENILIPSVQIFLCDRIYSVFAFHHYGLTSTEAREQLIINYTRCMCIICKKYFHAVPDKELLIFHFSKCFYEKCIWLEKRYDAKLK